MCFNIRQVLKKSLKLAKKDGDLDEAGILKQLILELETDSIILNDYYQVSAFSHPKVIVFANTNPNKPILSQWGLIPDWANEPDKIWNSTLNARGETIFEKPSFKRSAHDKRCIIAIEGFYEHHDYKSKKYPFYITRKDTEPLYIAGLWNDWTNKQTGEILNTFSIVTTNANALMAKIHNNPKASESHRMPVILTEALALEWMKQLSEKEIRELAKYQFPDSQLDSWTVRKLSGKDSPGNVPEANEKYKYEDLVFDDNRENTLF